MISKAMALFKAPSIKRVCDCGGSETLTIKNTAATTTRSSTLTSQLSLSSSNSTKNGDVELIKVVEADEEHNSCPSNNDDDIGYQRFLAILKSPSGSCKEKNDAVPIEVNESEGDAVYNKLFVKEHESPHTISHEPMRETSIFPKDDVDDVANFIDVKKLVGKSETNYYYSKANLSSRKKVEKIKMKKKRRRSLDNFDDSVDSRTDFLRHCIRASAYKGPTAVKKDGSSLQSIMTRRINVLTPIDSTLSTEASHGDKAVTFSHVDLREYERVPGDNPCVRGGVPLSIGWKHVQHDPICLDDYERFKGPPRDKIEMMVPASVRRSMLRDEFGASIHELNAAMKSANISKRQRAHTIASENSEVFQEVLESAERKFKRVVGKAASSEKQAEELWEASRDAVMNEYLQNASTHLVSNESATDSLTS